MIIENNNVQQLEVYISALLKWLPSYHNFEIMPIEDFQIGSLNYLGHWLQADKNVSLHWFDCTGTTWSIECFMNQAANTEKRFSSLNSTHVASTPRPLNYLGIKTWLLDSLLKTSFWVIFGENIGQNLFIFQFLSLLDLFFKNPNFALKLVHLFFESLKWLEIFLT